jgi:hypothetical protein
LRTDFIDRGAAGSDKNGMRDMPKLMAVMPEDERMRRAAEAETSVPTPSTLSAHSAIRMF